MKKSSIWISITVIISVIVSFISGVYIASADNIKNKQNQYKNHIFKTEDMVFQGWDKDSNKETYTTSTERPVIILNGFNDYVNNIYFDGKLDDYKEKTIRVYYTTSEGEEFSDAKSFDSLVELKGQKAYFTVDKTVCSIKVQLYESAGRTSEINAFEFNPKYYNFSFGLIFSILTILVIIITVIILLTVYRKNYKGYLFAFNKYMSLLKNLIQRDLKVKYRRSALGIMWSVLNPLLMMLVISAVFANIFRFDIKQFPIYYITGAWIFNFVSEATNTSLTSVISAAPLIKKVYIPKYIFPLEKCLFSFVNMIFSLIAVAIVYLLFRVELHFTILLFPVVMIYTLLFSIGLGLILAAFNVFFRDIGHLYTVWVTAWMYFTPIIYPVSALPDAMVSFVKLNPLYYYVEYARDIMIYGNVPTLQQNIICIGFSLITLLIGLVVFKKKQDKFILYI